MEKLINLTPHSIHFVNEAGDVIKTVEPSGAVARVATKTVTVGDWDDLPITETDFGEVEGLPEPEPDTAYIVSSIVAQRCHGRLDVFIPNESVRDDKGRIVGCRSLGRI